MTQFYNNNNNLYNTFPKFKVALEKNLQLKKGQSNWLKVALPKTVVAAHISVITFTFSQQFHLDIDYLSTASLFTDSLACCSTPLAFDSRPHTTTASIHQLHKNIIRILFNNIIISRAGQPHKENGVIIPSA